MNTMFQRNPNVQLNRLHTQDGQLNSRTPTMSSSVFDLHHVGQRASVPYPPQYNPHGSMQHMQQVKLI